MLKVKKLIVSNVNYLQLNINDCKLDFKAVYYLYDSMRGIQLINLESLKRLVKDKIFKGSEIKEEIEYLIKNTKNIDVVKEDEVN
jgi:hypothetical protein